MSFGIINQINKLKQRLFKKTNDEDLNDLISKLLNPDPGERISWEQYFNHPFFK
jgi:serine/threonine protein kinase